MAETVTAPAIEEVGERLRHLRMRAMLSQSDLGRLARVSRATIQNIEVGRTIPQGSTLRMLAGALRLNERDTRWFVSGEGTPLPLLDPILPAEPVTPFVGRQHDLDTIAALLADPGARLLTLTGPGGIGKTRLALEAAAWAVPRFAAVEVVPLALLSDPGDLLPAIAAALRVSAASSDALPETLANALAGRGHLLVLDNLEHLLPALPQLAELLRAAPALKLLVTSREALRLPGERILVVQPLPADGPDSPAVDLFTRLARASAPGLAANHATADIQAICQRLGGFPLAIELAAAQMDVLAPPDLLALMDTAGLGALAPALPEATHRFASMQDAIAWSVDRLSPDDQRLLRALAVFTGGFTSDAAATVLATAHPEPPAAPAAIAAAFTRFARAHLIQRWSLSGNDPGRFTMLEPIRLFALARLREASEEPATRCAQARWAFQLASALDPGILGPDGAPGLDAAQAFSRMERDYPNLRAALDWAIASGDGQLAGDLIRAIFPFWLYRDHSDDALLRLERADAVPDLSPEARGFLFFAAAEIAYRRGDLDRVRALSARLLGVGQLLGSPLAIAGGKLYLSLAAPGDDHRADAIRLIEEAQATLGPTVDWDPPFMQSWASMRLGIERHRIGDLAGARAELERATAMRHESGRRNQLPGSGGHLGLVLDDLGEPRAAAAAIADDILVASRLGDRWTAYHLGTWLLLTLVRHASADPGLALAAAGLLAALVAQRERRGYVRVPAEEARLAEELGRAPLPEAQAMAPLLDAAVEQIAELIPRLPERTAPRIGARLKLPPLA
ncbi:MAG: ATP-binding protein [Thermomicrobiales bacterium]